MAKAEKQTDMRLSPEQVAEIDAAMEADNARIRGGAPPPPLTLWQKIAKAMELVGYVQKRGKNAFHKYSYATAADVAEKAREAFLEVGLLFLPTVKSVETREKNTAKGGLTYITRVTMSYQVLDAAIGGSMFYQFEMVGEGQDEGDKSVFKALTGCHKYALMQLLMVSTGDDPEADEKTDQHKPVPPPISADQVVILESLIDTHGANLEKLLDFFSVTKLTEMTAAQFERACSLLEKRK